MLCCLSEQVTAYLTDWQPSTEYLELSQIVELRSTDSTVKCKFNILFKQFVHSCSCMWAGQQKPSRLSLALASPWGFSISEFRDVALWQNLRNSKFQQLCPAKYTSLVLCWGKQTSDGANEKLPRNLATFFKIKSKQEEFKQSASLRNCVPEGFTHTFQWE